MDFSYLLEEVLDKRIINKRETNSSYILKNPTRSEVRNLKKDMIKDGLEMVGIRFLSGKNLYMWSGYYHTHFGMKNLLNLKFYKNGSIIDKEYYMENEEIDKRLEDLGFKRSKAGGSSLL